MKGTLKGNVLERTGDFMPPMPTGQMTPLKTRVFIYDLPIPRGECISPWDASLKGEVPYEYGDKGWLTGMLYLGSQVPVVTANTNENGEFHLELEPGEYSVFVEWHGKPYINFSNLRYQGWVEIKAGETLERNLVINKGTD